MFEQLVDQVNSFVWGPVMLILLLGTGFYLTIGLKGMTINVSLTRSVNFSKAVKGVARAKLVLSMPS